MHIVPIIMADLRTAPLGQRSRLADDLHGMPVIRRTVLRVRSSTKLGPAVVCCHPRDVEVLAQLLNGLNVRIETHDKPPPYAPLVRHARQWGMDGWRGGIGGMCWFDEEAHVPVAAAIATQCWADAVAIVPGHACLIDPVLTDAMCAHFAYAAPLFQMTFCTAPPGMAPALFSTPFLQELAPTGQPPGTVLAYRPDAAAPDLTGKDACYRPAAVIAELGGRVLADTAAGWRLLDELLAAGAEAWSAEQIATRMRSRGQSDNADYHTLRDIEVELTTDDVLSHSRVRPRGACVPRRGPLSRRHIERIAQAVNELPDVRVLLGGFGDPLMHPDLLIVLRTLRDAGALSIAIRTSGLAGGAELDTALFDAPADVLMIMLDAATPEVYQSVHGVDGYAQAVARIESWLESRVTRRQVAPLIVPEFTKCTLNLADMEAFFDHWHRRLGWAVINGYSTSCGTLADLRVMPMAPPRRVPCRRLFGRMMVLADGAIVSCDQDHAGTRPLGHLDRASLIDTWRGAVAGLRAEHLAGRAADLPLCSTCDEWHRP